MSRINEVLGGVLLVPAYATAKQIAEMVAAFEASKVRS